MELFYRLRAELGQMFCWFGRIKANKINIDWADVKQNYEYYSIAHWETMLKNVLFKYFVGKKQVGS